MMYLREIVRKFRSDSIGGIFARQASGSFIINMGGLALGFFLEIFFARILGVKEYGDYTYVMSWVTILSSWAILGLDISIIRYLSAYYAGREWSLFRGLLIRGNQIVLGISVILASLMAVLIW